MQNSNGLTLENTRIMRLEMFQAACEYLDSHTETWYGIPLVVRHKNDLARIISEIRDVAKREGTEKQIFNSSLRMLKKSVSDKMDILDDIMEAYAEDIQDEELRAKASNTSTDYFRLTYDEFEAKVSSVLGLMESNVHALEDYGMTQQQIDDVRLTFHNFLKRRGISLNTPEIVIHNQTIGELFEAAESVIKKLDEVLKSFRYSHTYFYLGYLTSRQVIDVRG